MAYHTRLDYAEFYITNVCNLSCQNCNRFNDYHFTGWQAWSDYKEIYKQWAEEVNLYRIHILGGEPTLNPTLLEWTSGIRQLWPNAGLGLVTNGTHLNKVKGLYQNLVDNRVDLRISVHSEDMVKEITNTLNVFAKNPKRTFVSTAKDLLSMQLTDDNGLLIYLTKYSKFHQSSIRTLDDGSLSLHNSDKIVAHYGCDMKTCHHFIKGKLYKCGVAALLPEFDSQFNLKLSESDRDLMNSYRPLEITDSTESKIDFVKNLKKPIEQCKFCPESYQSSNIVFVKSKHR